MARIFNLGSCGVSRTDRVVRTVIGLWAALIALSGYGNALCTVAAGTCATFLLVGAVTGWCPNELLRRRPRSQANAEAFGIPTAPAKTLRSTTRS